MEFLKRSKSVNPLKITYATGGLTTFDKVAVLTHFVVIQILLNTASSNSEF